MLSGKPQGASGSIVSCSMEGTRPILVEVQALVCRSNLAMPRRTAAGTDYNRVGLLMAVIEKRIGMHLSTCDAYVNIAGGIRMNEPAIDLAIVLALISSYKDIAIDEKNTGIRRSWFERRDPCRQHGTTESGRGQETRV